MLRRQADQLQIGDRVRRIAGWRWLDSMAAPFMDAGTVSFRSSDTVEISWDRQEADRAERFGLDECGTLRRLPRRV